MSEDLSQVACAYASWDSGTGTGCPWDFRVLVLLSEPYPGDPDNDDPEEGRRIVQAVKAAGGWVRVELLSLSHKSAACIIGTSGSRPDPSRDRIRHCSGDRPPRAEDRRGVSGCNSVPKPFVSTTSGRISDRILELLPNMISASLLHFVVICTSATQDHPWRDPDEPQ